MLDQFPIEVFDFEQGTPEWHQVRAGIPTTSEFSTILAKGRSGGESKTRKTYLYKLAGERITGEAVQTWAGNAHTERGHAMEPEARNLYAARRACFPHQVGFIRRGPVGCSPDSLLDDDGLLEIKSKLPHLQCELLDSGVLPPEHKAQVQGQLWVSDRRYVDFMSYWPKLPPFICRVERDEMYIAELAKAVRDFLSELDEITARIAALKEAA